VLRKESEDYAWCANGLAETLAGYRADAVVWPDDDGQLAAVLAIAYELRVPVTIRGGGTGNYGQCVPLAGGLVIDTGRLNRILDIGDGYARVQAGVKLVELAHLQSEVYQWWGVKIEVDGREKQVDSYYYGKKTSKQRPPLMYWGKYVAHDNNRDGMGQYLKLTQNMTKTFLEWHPTILHDLHEAQSYLYVSTGTGPYNNSLDPIQVNEWWLLAETEVMEMAKRGVPGVWTHGFYDGWAPNYMLYIATGHNAIGRFYETFGNGGADTLERTLDQEEYSRTWYRQNPPLPKVLWSQRDNNNYEETGLLTSLHYFNENKRLFLKNFYLKAKRSVMKPSEEGPAAYVLPADGPRLDSQAELLRVLQKQKVEISRATAAFTVTLPDGRARQVIHEPGEVYPISGEV